MAGWMRFLQIAFLLVTVILIGSNDNSARVEATAAYKHRCDQHYQSPNMLTCSYSRTQDDFFDIRLRSCNLTVTSTKKKRFAFGYLNLEDLADKDFFARFGEDDTDDFQITYSSMPTFPFPDILKLKSKLSILGLEYNSITEWDNLTTIDLNFASSLTRLYLDGNSITQLPDNAFIAFKALKTLNLPKNKLNYITKTIFSGQSAALTTLVLRDNNIMYIDKGALDNLEGLRKLDLSGNKLAALEPDTITSQILEKITDIRLGGNPFFAYSFNQWLFTGISKNPEVLLYSNATCTRPVVGNFTTVFTSTTLITIDSLVIAPMTIINIKNPANF